MARPRRKDNVVIREREPGDDEAIRRLNDLAFGGSEESELVVALRAADLAAVELVWTEGREIVGHLMMSALSVFIDDEPVPSLSLAPMSVRPDRQRIGIGTALVEAGLELARKREWQAVIVLGHPDFYPRFGFEAELAEGLEAPFSGEAFMALELVDGALDGDDGLVVYPSPFGLDPEEN
jgi:putative acetyltransferase